MVGVMLVVVLVVVKKGPYIAVVGSYQISYRWGMAR